MNPATFVPAVDPIDLQLFRNLMEAAAEQMGITLQRVSYSANIKERRDFSCALFDAQGRLLAQAAHIPVHLGSMPASVAAVLGAMTLGEGDVAVVNDPFAGGSHLPDITTVSAIFSGGVLAGYAATRAHHADVGGTSPGSMTLSTHIDQEGVRLSPMLLMRGGQREEGTWHAILSAVRTPAERTGDLEAQLAAAEAGAAAVRRIVSRHGKGYFDFYAGALLDYSQKFMSRAIAAIPDGHYAFADALEGLDNQPIGISAMITIRGDRATVDLSACADQVALCVNCPPSVAASAVYYCFACLLEADAPLNAGAFRNITVLTRAGSVVAATYPAPVVAGNTETSQRVVDVVLGALARALPHRIPAASCGSMSSVALGGEVPGVWTYYETIGGGCGAGPEWAGEHAVQCHMTNTLNTPAEALEMQYPLRVTRFERAVNSGGEGKHPGGDGIIREIEALAACSGTILSDRRVDGPYSLAGGEPGSTGMNTKVHTDGSESLLAGKTAFTLAAGERLRIVTPAGGGWGEAGW